MFNHQIKEKPFFTGITRGVGGSGFGRARSASRRTGKLVRFKLWGGAGGTSQDCSGNPSGSAAAGGFIDVEGEFNPGTTFYIVVAGGGSFNGGGGYGGGGSIGGGGGGSGGGASYVIFNSSTATLSNLVVVAGGGAGGQSSSGQGIDLVIIHQLIFQL